VTVGDKAPSPVLVTPISLPNPPSASPLDSNVAKLSDLTGQDAEEDENCASVSKKHDAKEQAEGDLTGAS